MRTSEPYLIASSRTKQAGQNPSELQNISNWLLLETCEHDGLSQLLVDLVNNPQRPTLITRCQLSVHLDTRQTESQGKSRDEARRGRGLLTHVPAPKNLPQVAAPERLAKHGGVRDVELDQLGHQLGVCLSEHPGHQAPPVVSHLNRATSW